MIERKITVDGKEYTLRASALIPRLYRAKFGRDLVTDMRRLADAYKNAAGATTDEEREAAQLSAVDLGVFEDVAWIMMKHGGMNVGESPDEWLDSLDGIFSVYEALPVIMEMWSANNKTTSTPRKK